MAALPTHEQLGIDADCIIVPIFIRLASDAFLWTRWSLKHLHPCYLEFLGTNLGLQCCLFFPSVPVGNDSGYSVPDGLAHDIFHGALDPFMDDLASAASGAKPILFRTSSGVKLCFIPFLSIVSGDAPEIAKWVGKSTSWNTAFFCHRCKVASECAFNSCGHLWTAAAAMSLSDEERTLFGFYSHGKNATAQLPHFDIHMAVVPDPLHCFALGLFPSLRDVAEQWMGQVKF